MTVRSYIEIGSGLETEMLDDEEIIAALKLVYERMKIVVEPSAVVTLAALIKNKNLFEGKRVGIIFSGGNVDLKKLSEWC